MLIAHEARRAARARALAVEVVHVGEGAVVRHLARSASVEAAARARVRIDRHLGVGGRVAADASILARLRHALVDVDIACKVSLLLQSVLIM